MNRFLHGIHGLDHKCRSCGHALVEHDEATLECPDADNRKGYTYEPKGPLVPAELRVLMLELEDAAIILAGVHGCTPHDHPENKKARDAYKAARFALNCYLARVVWPTDALL